MKKLRVLFFILLCIWLVSCSTDGVQKGKIIKVKKSYNTNLVPGTKRLTFPLNSRIVNRSICILPYTAPDSSEYLFYLNGKGNDICIFSIDSSKLVKTIKLQSEGPNGVGGMVRGFEVITFDSIYVTSALLRLLFIVNSDAKVISTIKYSKFKQDYPIQAGSSRTSDNNRLGFKNGKIYISFHPPYDEGNYRSIKIGNIRYLAEIDPVKKEANVLNIGFPADYWKNHYYPLFVSSFIYKNKFYIHYMYDDRILISNDSKNWKTYIIPSKYVDVKKVVRKGMSGWCINPNYFCFVPDPYRNVFYRFVVHEPSNIKNRTHMDLVQYPQKFSIIILDKDMNIIGETIFPTDVYDMHGYFINKDGLYLSRSNPLNPEYDEDKLEFQLINLVKNEK